jgi:murein DD-endopeptidase MepM/ murein hydrolase activator NlpD
MTAKSSPKNKRKSYLVILAIIIVTTILLLAYIFSQGYSMNLKRTMRVLSWIRDPQVHRDWLVEAGQRCLDAPFIMPTSGFIGFLWGDSFRIGHKHQGIDIFGDDGLGTSPVIAAYSGYLTRLPDWKATLIIRIPEDPLKPERQIWTYYTHMADPEGNSFISEHFPPGTNELYVEAGTLLGYQGNYSGDPSNPVGVHLHFSIVKDDGKGSFRNELKFQNTLDPSPYFKLPLNAKSNQNQVPLCKEQLDSKGE